MRKVAHNIGEPLPFEEQSLQKSDEQEIVISIAKSIGIEINHKLEDIVCYEYLNSTNI
ncbi:hypothetical protein ACE193_22190 [Bernardetia sp. OM2101]|uniref:hypothetical protein n=1 Tax=Bernardetia sp. OM2101 TaxID=3344876 RepID=UPI0035D0B0E7